MRLPAAPPAMRPAEIVGHGVRSHFEPTATATMNTIWMVVNSHVEPVPMENAAPGLRSSVSWNHSPSRSTGALPSKASTATILEI